MDSEGRSPDYSISFRHKGIFLPKNGTILPNSHVPEPVNIFSLIMHQLMFLHRHLQAYQVLLWVLLILSGQCQPQFYMHFLQNHPLVHTAWEICRWHHERWDGKGYPDGLKGEEIPISAQVVSIVDVYDALTSERCYKKAFDHDTAIQMILDGQCGQFNPTLLNCLKELSIQLSKMLNKEMDDNKYSHEIQRLSNEILSDKSLPSQIYSQSLVKVMQEKIDFFKSNSGMNSIDYNAVSGQLTILNGNQQILCQRNNPKIDLFKEFGVNQEDVQYIRVLLHQTSVQNKEISVQIKATVENNSQMYKMKLHTLWSPMKKDVCIGIIGYFDTVK